MRKKIENCVFIFEKQEDMENFWNNYILQRLPDETDVVGNTFVVSKFSSRIAKILLKFFK